MLVLSRAVSKQMESKGSVAVAERTMAHAYASTDVSTRTKTVKLKPATTTIRWRSGAAVASAVQTGCKSCRESTAAPLLTESQLDPMLIV